MGGAAFAGASTGPRVFFQENPTVRNYGRLEGRRWQFLWPALNGRGFGGRKLFAMKRRAWSERGMRRQGGLGVMDNRMQYDIAVVIDSGDDESEMERRVVVAAWMRKGSGGRRTRC